MKIYGSALLALVGIHSCSAFISQPAASTYSSSRLFSERMPQRVNAGEGYPRSSADVINTDLSRRASAEDYGIGGALLAEPPVSASLSQLDDTWHNSRPVKVQGGSLRTWSFESPRIEYVQVLMKTEGRPLNAEVELWQGPDNSPERMGVYVEDASVRPFHVIIATPRGSNTVSIRNTAHLEFPLDACVEADNGSAGLGAFLESNQKMGRTIQGGAVYTTPFDAMVESVSIFMRTDGRPLNARVELLQGPNNNKQVMELYTEDGLERPFFSIVETPGTGNVVRIVNTATVEFPLYATIEPYSVRDPSSW
jgi:hypothetical protein